MAADPRPRVSPPALIFEFLYDAQSSVVSAAEAAGRHIPDPAAAAELSDLAAAIAVVRARYASNETVYDHLPPGELHVGTHT